MYKINISDFKRLSIEEAKRLMPAVLLFEGEPIALFCDIRNTIDLTGLHPHMRAKIKALEAVGRAGLPPAERMIVKRGESKPIRLQDLEEFVPTPPPVPEPEKPKPIGVEGVVWQSQRAM